MTEENKKLLERINKYAETSMKDIDDPQKVLVSVQLDRLRPVLEEIAMEKNISIEEMFILYMDLQSENSCMQDQKLKDSLRDLNSSLDGNPPLLFR